MTPEHELEPLIDSHEHEYDGIPDKGRVALCVDRRCTHVVVGTGIEWREPTATERTNITIRMWEDVILADAFAIIHGKERGHARLRYLRGYTDHE